MPGASIADFASHGLDSGGQFLAGAPASLFGLTPDTGAAFPGINPLVGRNTMFFPAGRSLYSGIQLSLRTHLTNPVRGVLGGSLQFTYTHSSFRSNFAGGLADQDLLPLAADFNHPIAFFGSASQDRKNQFSLGSILDLPRGIRLGLIAQVASPLPQTLYIPASGGVPGEIFRSDVTGDGSFGGQSQTGGSSYGDILPGTNIGAFGRAVKDQQPEHTYRKLQHPLRRSGDSRRPGPGQCRIAFTIATGAAGCGLADHRGSSGRKRRPGVDENFRLDPGPALPDGRPLCC